jgi:hypothetical protein
LNSHRKNEHAPRKKQPGNRVSAKYARIGNARSAKARELVAAEEHTARKISAST